MLSGIRTASLPFVLVLVGVACGGGEGSPPDRTGLAAPPSIHLTSPAFVDGGPIPATFTCDGEDVSPALAWELRDGPAREFVLFMLDPDAPGGDFAHWVVFGIPGKARSFSEGDIPGAAEEGRNSFDDPGYAGPCPPQGDPPHHYVFTLYALERVVSEKLSAGATADEVLDTIDCCVRSKGTLTGTYGR